jgi:hypothetical protein
MAISGTKAGDAQLLKYMLGISSASSTCFCRLYSNNHVPAYDDVIGTYTQLVATGYSAASLSSLSWTIVASDPYSYGTYVVPTWTIVGAATAYGYYVVDFGASVVFFAELFATPYVFTVGGLINLQLQFGLQ